jgi:peptide/nickel transport system substrate-binding protein
MSEIRRSSEQGKLVRSRRDLLKYAAATGGAAGMSSFMPGVKALAAAPKGGHLKLGLEGASANLTLDPASISAQYAQNIGFMWGNCLVEVDEQSKMIPELAESWEPDASATKWVFKLRKGVQFHNGKEMTAADVVYSINHHRGPDSKSGAKGSFKGVTDVKATDQYEVTLILARPNVDAYGLLADYHILIMPEGSDPKSGVGTGPYPLEEFSPAVRAVGKRNPNYWKADRAHADSVEVLAINDDTARMSAIQSGQVDFITRVDPKLVKTIQANDNLDLIEVRRAAHYSFIMRRDMPPFNDKDLCYAFKYAIDRTDLVNRILLGHGFTGNDQPVPPFDPMFSKEVPSRTYDPDKAQFHYKRSGHSGPVQLFISDAAFPNAVAAAQLYQQHATKAGIAIDIQRVPKDGYWDDIWMKKTFCGSYYGGRSPCSLFLEAFYLSGAPWNESYWKRPDFDELFAKAQAEFDIAKRKEMYHELQMMIWDDSGIIIPMFAHSLLAKTKRVEGMVKSPVFTGFRVAEQLYVTN